MMRRTADYGRPPSADDGATSKERSGRCRRSGAGCAGASIIEVMDGGLRLRPRAGLRRQIWKLLSHCNVMQCALVAA